MILTAHQPVYLPWLGLFHKIAEADLFCYFDIVQYQKKDFNNRNKIKTSSGSHWLSVPVKSKNHLNTLISEAQIVEDGWRKKHLKSIYLSYKKSPYFEEYYSELEKIILNENHDLLTDLNYDLLVFFLNALSINVPIVKASSYSFQGLKSDLVMDMCIKLNASNYIFGENGIDYANEESFNRNNINVHFQDYKHPEYNQLWGKFLPYMSIIDLLFNEGSKSYEILMKENYLFKKG